MSNLNKINTLEKEKNWDKKWKNNKVFFREIRFVNKPQIRLNYAQLYFLLFSNLKENLVQ